jgi:hypothetical protein
LLPKYYVNSSLWIDFGSNTIDVKPTGSVEMDLCASQNKIIRPFLQETDPIYRLTLIKG